jgi:4-aminobutyrate aminotransferase
MGNPVCASAGLAVLRTIGQEQLVEHAGDVGGFALSTLNALRDRHPLIRDVRGRGLAIGIELARSDGSPAGLETAKVVYRAFELGVVMFYVGVDSNVIELTPPLTITADELEVAARTIDEAVASVERGEVEDSRVASFAGW